jgi:L-threonylcarbamoyladenylate synthase
MLRTGEIAQAVAVLKAGGVVAYATDTLYGLAVDPRSPAAVDRLFEVKARQAGHAVPMIAASLAQAERAAQLDPTSVRLAEQFWPGPLTLILRARPGLCAGIAAADGTVALRVPDSAAARALAAGLDFCITSTSANLSGQPASASPDEVARAIGERIDLLFDTGRSPGGSPSTIVDGRGGVPRLVRDGAIAWDRVLHSLQ